MSSTPNVPAHRLLALVLPLALAACHPGGGEHPTASPDPAPSPTVAASASPAKLSLAALVPSPEPSQTLPKMPAPVAGRFLFYDDFEHDMSRWTATGGAAGVGWYRIESKSCGGLYTMVLGHADNSEFTKVRAEADLATVKPIDLSHAKRAQLQYDLKGITRPFDVITVRAEARKPGGTWTPVGAVAHAQYPTVVTFTADLAPYVGGPVEVRFHGTVNGADRPNKGIFLDDVHVVEGNG